MMFLEQWWCSSPTSEMTVLVHDGYIHHVVATQGAWKDYYGLPLSHLLQRLKDRRHSLMSIDILDWVDEVPF